jgi:hypothetical protein
VCDDNTDMPTSRSAFFLAITLAAAALGLGGCASVDRAAQHTVAWVRDALQTQLDYPIDRVARASVEALRDMKFADVTAKTDVIYGVVTAKTARDEKVSVELTSISDGRTVVDIRIGVISDKAVATKILDHIKKNL